MTLADRISKGEVPKAGDDIEGLGKNQSREGNTIIVDQPWPSTTIASTSWLPWASDPPQAPGLGRGEHVPRDLQLKSTGTRAPATGG